MRGWSSFLRLLLLLTVLAATEAQPRRARMGTAAARVPVTKPATGASNPRRRAAKPTPAEAEAEKPAALSLMDLVMQEETALQDIAARATTMHQKAKQMKADKLVDYLSAGRQTTLVADLMAQNQRLRAAAIAQGGEAATQVHGLPLLLATDSHAQRLEQPTEEEQVASAEENASFQEAEKAVAETMAAAAVAVAEAERQVEAAVETAQATEAATAMTEAKLAQVESQVEEAAQQEEAGAGDADPVAFSNDAPVEVSAADDDARELQQLLSQLDDEDDEWLLQSVWEAMGIHNEKHQHLGQGILGAVVAGLVIFAMIAIANCQTSTKRVRRVAR